MLNKNRWVSFYNISDVTTPFVSGQYTNEKKREAAPAIHNSIGIAAAARELSLYESQSTTG